MSAPGKLEIYHCKEVTRLLYVLFRTVTSSFRKGVRHFCVTVTQ